MSISKKLSIYTIGFFLLIPGLLAFFGYTSENTIFAQRVTSIARTEKNPNNSAPIFIGEQPEKFFREAVKVDLIKDIRVIQGEQVSIELTELVQQAGRGATISLAIGDGNVADGEFPWLVRDRTRNVIHLRPTNAEIGVHKITVHAEGIEGDFEDVFRVFVNAARLQDIPTEILDTVLLDLPLKRIHLEGLNKNIWRNRGAIGIDHDRVLICDSANQFFLLDLTGGEINMTKLPIEIRTNKTELEKTFKEGSHFGIPIVAIQDILFIEGGQKVAISYSQWNIEKECISIKVTTFDFGVNIDNDKREDIFQSSPCVPINADFPNLAGHQAGGRMVLGGSGEIFLTVGDLAKDIYPQSADADLGKIFAISTQCCEREIISFGHRNLQGLVKTSIGELWATEHGPRGGDEINHIVSGNNYGWPLVSLGVNYDKKQFADHPVAGLHNQHVLPVYAWLPSVGIGNIIQVTGFEEAWEGDFLVNSLKGESLRRLRIRDNRVVYDEPIDLGSRLRDSGQLADGSIVVLTDDGQLLLFPSSDTRAEKSPAENVLAALGARAGEEFKKCLECHSANPDTQDSQASVNLALVYDRKIAGSSRYTYSQALQEVNGKWSDANLDSFLADPQEFSPGTKMAYQGLDDEILRTEIIEALQAFSR